MGWLVPSIIASMMGTLLLVCLYFYLYLQDKSRYMLIWTWSWLVYTLRFILTLAMASGHQNPYLLIGSQMSNLVSGLLLLWGTYAFKEESMPGWWVPTAGAVGVWIVMSVTFDATFLVMSLPTFTFIAMVNVYTGIMFVRAEKEPRGERRITGWAFILWGLHKADYPFLRPVVWFAPWGFLLGAALEFIVAFGIVLLYLKRAMRATEMSALRMRALVETIPDLVWLKDPDGVYLSCNLRFERFFGAKEKDIVGKTDYDFVDAELADFFRKKDKLAMAAGKPSVNEEVVTYADDGHTELLETIKTPVYDATGSIVGVLGVARDITQRKNAEAALKTSEAMQRKMVANIGDVIVIIDDEGLVRYKSENIERWFGWTPEELIGRPALENVHPEDAASSDRFINALLEAPDQTGHMECRYRCKDGSYRWIRFTGKNLLHDPDIIGILGNYHDISQRKQTEASLRESERRFKALHNASFGGIAIHDQGTILECNDGLAEMMGYAESELIGMNGLCLIAEECRDMARERMLSGLGESYETKGLRKSGQTFPLRLESRRIPYKGKMVGTVEFRDITEQKQSEREREELQARLNQAQKMESIGQLAGGVAHDFNNMLSIILGHTDIILEDLDPEDPIVQNLIEVQKAAQRSTTLTRQLLAFVRKQTISPRIVDLNETVEGMLKMLRRLIGEDIDLTWQPKFGLWPVKIDPSQVDQVLANLCVNARDAIGGVGKVSIETRNISIDCQYCNLHSGFKPGEFVLMSVSDNGCGMDSKTVDRLFEPFFTTKGLGEGTGLGMATVYGIVKQNKGFIHVYSELNKGSTFKIYLPRYDRPMAEDEPDSEKPEVLRGHETVLLVEDEKAILNSTRMMLERLGYTVLTALTVQDALDHADAAAADIDLLITDVVMPEMNGRNLAEQIRGKIQDIKCLFMSGYTADVIAHHGILDEGLNFLNKPFSIQTLSVKVREILDSS